jgi:hypothetical protein
LQPKTLTAALLIAIMYALHQGAWFWTSRTPFVFGFLPIGLFYHTAYTIVTSALLWLLVRLTWPSHLDPEGPSAE